MNRTDLEKLQQVEAFPAVSILSPLDRRRPGNAKDPLRLRHLLDDARRRLVAEYAEQAIAPVISRLESAVAGIDLDHPAEGVAIFVTSEETNVLSLPFPVRERVVTDGSFATRDLVVGLARSPRYRALVLSEKPTRLFEAVADRFVEVQTGGFPIWVEGARGEPLESGDYAVHTSRSEESNRQFFRGVDHAFGHVSRHEPLPCIVLGAERDLAYFDAVTEHAASIVGRVHGNYDEATEIELVPVVWPVVQKYLEARNGEAIAQLVAAVGAKRAAIGIKQVWQPALDGRGHLLLVEHDYRDVPYRVVDGYLEPVADVDAPGVIEDVVDEVVEAVLLQRGDVAFVKTLGEHGPIALVLRY